MPKPRNAVAIHSLTEASLYVMLSPCAVCGGPLWLRIADCAGPDAQHRLTAAVACQTCGGMGQIAFDVSRVEPTVVAGGLQAWARQTEAGHVPPINPVDEPSQAIDVAGWVMLYTILSGGGETSDKSPDACNRGLIRQLRIQAGRCLAEALKFYDADNDLPPADAFFTKVGRQQFREHPELFLRGRLASLRVKMPVGKTTEGDRNQLGDRRQKSGDSI